MEPMAPAPSAGPKAKLVGIVGASCAALVLVCVQHFEGRRLEVYPDPVGIPTVCDGVTGPGVQIGQAPRTDAQCDQLLVDNLVRTDAGVQGCIHRPMVDGQRAAFDSFAYNVGVAKFCASTMARKFNAGDAAGACAELSRWVYAGPNVLPGLVKRRAAERALCEGRGA